MQTVLNYITFIDRWMIDAIKLQPEGVRCLLHMAGAGLTLLVLSCYVFDSQRTRRSNDDLSPEEDEERIERIRQSIKPIKCGDSEKKLRDLEERTKIVEMALISILKRESASGLSAGGIISTNTWEELVAKPE